MQLVFLTSDKAAELPHSMTLSRDLERLKFRQVLDYGSPLPLCLASA